MTPMTMLGAVQLGSAAACVVILIPVVMSGWHLRRNRILLFIAVLFITLAVCLHYTPYFPSVVSDFVTSVSSVVVIFDHRSSCINSVNDISFHLKRKSNNNYNNASSSLDFYTKSWEWSNSPKLISCDFQKLTKPDVSELLNGSHVVIAGDSQARFFTLSLLNLLLGPHDPRMDPVKTDLFNRHTDYTVLVNEFGLKLDFIWAPYVVNLTNTMMGFEKNRNYPDVMVMGAGLWHMLHVTNASDYGLALRMLKSSVVTGSVSVKKPHSFWLGMPILINGMLNTQQKRRKMSDAMWHAYDRALGDSRLLRQTGGPLVLLDIQSLTWNCGPRCTFDGMHYDLVIYEAAVQIMLNALLIEPHQSL